MDENQTGWNVMAMTIPVHRQLGTGQVITNRIQTDTLSQPSPRLRHPSPRGEGHDFASGKFSRLCNGLEESPRLFALLTSWRDRLLLL